MDTCVGGNCVMELPPPLRRSSEKTPVAASDPSICVMYICARSRLSAWVKGKGSEEEGEEDEDEETDEMEEHLKHTPPKGGRADGR